MPEIAIDACVFIHLLNIQEKNPDRHIDKLLWHYLKYEHLHDEKFDLLVDSTGKIAKDYVAQVIPMIRNIDDEGNQRILLSAWMDQNRWVNIKLDPTDRLMAAIKGVIHEVGEKADRAFVYVACNHGADLISNDEIHIWGRRRDLLKAAKKCGYKNTAIVSSREACEGIA